MPSHADVLLTRAEQREAVRLGDAGDARLARALHRSVVGLAAPGRAGVGPSCSTRDAARDVERVELPARCHWMGPDLSSGSVQATHVGWSVLNFEHVPSASVFAGSARQASSSASTPAVVHAAAFFVGAFHVGVNGSGSFGGHDVGPLSRPAPPPSGRKLPGASGSASGFGGSPGNSLSFEELHATTTNVAERRAARTNAEAAEAFTMVPPWCTFDATRCLRHHFRCRPKSVVHATRLTAPLYFYKLPEFPVRSGSGVGSTGGETDPGCCLEHASPASPTSASAAKIAAKSRARALAPYVQQLHRPTGDQQRRKGAPHWTPSPRRTRCSDHDEASSWSSGRRRPRELSRRAGCVWQPLVGRGEREVRHGGARVRQRRHRPLRCQWLEDR